MPEVELPVAVPFGHPLPPDMVWRRTFENLFQAPVVYEVPKPIVLQPISPVILSKRNWDFAFRELDFPLLTWKDHDPARPVARALFSEEIGEASEKAAPWLQ